MAVATDSNSVTETVTSAFLNWASCLNLVFQHGTEQFSNNMETTDLIEIWNLYGQIYTRETCV